MLQKNRKPLDVDSSILNEICIMSGYASTLSGEQLLEAFNVQQSLFQKSTQGSTNPKEVKILIDRQKGLLLKQKKHLSDRVTTVEFI